MPALIPIAIGASAAASVGSAALQSRAAGKAAKTQAAAANQALGFQREQYENTRRDFAPYQAGGRQAFSSLGQMMGLPPQASQAAPMPGGQPMSLAQMRGVSADNSARAPMATNVAPGMVLLEGPDGSRRAVPAQHAPHYLQRGARQVS